MSKSKETTTAFSGSVDIMIEGKAVNTSELPVFCLNAIVAATNDFCKENELGRGGFGPVYKVIDNRCFLTESLCFRFVMFSVDD